MELLVGIVLFATLSAVVVPSVVVQIRKSENTNILGNLDAIATGIESFQTDVNRWPTEVNQLVRSPGSGSGATGATDDVRTQGGTIQDIPSGQLKKWDGPYLGIGGLPGDGIVRTSLSGEVVREFVVHCNGPVTPNGGLRYLAIRVNGLSEADAKVISRVRDGTDDTDLSNPAHGTVRWNSGTLYFLATPLGPPKCTPS